MMDKLISIFKNSDELKKLIGEMEIANTIDDVLSPRGVGVIVQASHQCMTTRGVNKPGVDMHTSHMLGSFRENPSTRQEFMNIIGSGS